LNLEWTEVRVAYRTYTKLGTAETPQSEPIPGSAQVANSAGGYSYGLDDWKRLDRFLVLGSDGGTYYIGERKLTRENAAVVERCLAVDGARVVKRIVEISEAGRAARNDPALFALALAASVGNAGIRAYALDVLPRVARIGTHLFHFVAYVEQFRGYGRGLRKAIARWYLSKSAASVAYQAIKYQSRDKWSHRDLLRLAHPKAGDAALNDVFRWIVKGWDGAGEVMPDAEHLRQIWAFERSKTESDAAILANLIMAFSLPREAVPTDALNNKRIWQALLDEPMPMTAMIRNLATMTRVGLIGPMQAANTTIADRITDASALKNARVHPIQILAALKTYEQGHGERSQNTWEPQRQIVDALDSAFYKTFQNVEPSGKRIVLALDVSGSMGSAIAGVPGLSARDGSAAIALITAATEPNYQVLGFASASHGYSMSRSAYLASDPDDGLTLLDISPKQRLDDVIRRISGLPFGGTDCSLPMLWALKHNVLADAFVVYTDSETWAGRVHPSQVLKTYRQKTGINAKLIVVGMCSNGFTIADPKDPGMLDVVGFDTATPAVISDFIREE
jgi:60 kDa SS-A/Ro ribonucleoprotein